MNTQETDTKKAAELRELQSEVATGDTFTVPQRIVLTRSNNTGREGEWVTHREKVGTGERFWGHYFMASESKGGEWGAYCRAQRDYVKRCKEIGVRANLDVTESTEVSPNLIGVADRMLRNILGAGKTRGEV